MAKRKIIQIVLKPLGPNNSHLVALCDDGTLWRLIDDHWPWEQIRDVTQDEDETFKCKMCKDKGWIAGPGDSHTCPNCTNPNGWRKPRRTNNRKARR